MYADLVGASAFFPAGEIEEVVKGQLKAIFASPQILVEIWRKMRKGNKGFQEHDMHEALLKLGSFWDHLFPAEQKRITQLLIERVVINVNKPSAFCAKGRRSS